MTAVVYVPYVTKKTTVGPPAPLFERWLFSLRAEAEHAAERFGDLRGPVLPGQEATAARVGDVPEVRPQGSDAPRTPRIAGRCLRAA